MKREIIFRGKRVDNGEWAVGHCLSQNGRGVDGSSDVMLYFIIENGSYQMVDSETVGQYIGIIDQNGLMVFEDDIVNLYNKAYGRNQGVVKYFMHNNPSFQAEQTSEDFPSTYHLQVRKEEIEVIGNIHDNPELIERK